MQWGPELRGEGRLAFHFLSFRAEDSGFQLTQILKGGYCSEDGISEESGSQPGAAPLLSGRAPELE